VNTTTKAGLGQPAVIGGLVMGVLSALPIISAGNFCCCLWVLSGGIVAAYVLQQNQAAPITPGDGALVGLLAGLCGAVIQVVLSIPIGLLLAPIDYAMLERLRDYAPDLGDLVDRYGRDRAANRAFILAVRAAAFVGWLFVGAVFSTIGGLVGAALFKRRPPPGTIDIAPTQA
jgi:hypothetical protein